MNEKYKYLLMIDRYLAGEMDDAETRAFERDLRSNKDLLRELEFEKDISAIIGQQNVNVIEFRQKVIEAIIEAKQEKQLNRIFPLSRKYVTLMAASVTILIMIAASVYLLVPKTYTNDRLFTMYYKSNQIPIERSSDSYLFEALRFYQQKEYPSAIDLFNEVLVTDPDNSAVRFYLAISYIETNRINEALNNLELIIHQDKNGYSERAQWYLGLCMLKNNQTEQAIAQFRKIASDSNNYYKLDALKVLSQVKKMK
jgi:tetratricopeptide (TPR) repeat protein